MSHDPAHFSGTDQHGNTHEFVVLRNLSLETLEIMLDSQLRVVCPVELCDDGHIHEPTQRLVRGPFGIPQGIIISLKCHGPCTTCAGNGWVYALEQN